MSTAPCLAYLLGREINGEMEYWTGEVKESGFPRTSLWKSDAYHFTTPRAAYEAAATHKALRLSDEWKAVPRSRLLY